MKTLIPGPLPERGRNLMRKVGYGEKPGFKGQISYTRRVQGYDFPRFHAYLEESGDGSVQVNLHLDQKPASYEGSHAHSGEYEGPLVEREMARIVATIKSFGAAPRPSTPPPEPEEKKGFWESLFG